MPSTRSLVAHVLTAALVGAMAPARASDALYERPITVREGTVREVPSGAEMAGDALVGRPLLLATTVVGLATFLVALPFTITGRNVGESADRLVGGPLRATFARCLGCTTPDQSTHSSQSRSYGEEYDTAY